ncbi:hypothetical protein G5T42_04710 [Microbacterium sp. 4R-513]|uniref:hypothetical protein n=1 Tax=Microbacterium sp. 4R-513 TaxID=2567934 RepID=UPI0013E17D2A|nr:hypothetical protein [Microbacterium sp. 4R-513]QIG38873.1 hypothetical protein G5T42_04710 [Microbacterium sp. 4R-513]
MTETLLSSGDEIAVTITAVKPFGMFVETAAGVPGLVRGSGADIGDVVRVGVVEFDPAARRFSATLA